MKKKKLVVKYFPHVEIYGESLVYIIMYQDKNREPTESLSKKISTRNRKTLKPRE